MFSECRQYLITKLQEAGVRSKPFTSEKLLSRSQDSHVAAVLFESETILRNGSKKRFIDQEGAQKKRRKVFDRGLAFTVTIGDYSDDAVEATFERFLAGLDAGIMVSGDFIAIDPDGADWYDGEDSILKAKVAVQVKIRFDGGIYRDTGFAKLKAVEVEDITKGKEP